MTRLNLINGNVSYFLPKLTERVNIYIKLIRACCDVKLLIYSHSHGYLGVDGLEDISDGLVSKY